ncbi:serine hydrolase domain-containing protein [Glaciecola petra]|uniref:Serine hydrolase domain-containing protein n=1 Tax=Glaciecola petra TaxID=3075602 RepID=A0ABU2ZSJ4_9ALTE|nr:serine hydrolase domain-containing protein [Aestuariibacter sp. P117]MDT0595284.1 serine hydrolase domain-containing protein [Aestuariibacter sp. P117]
MALKTTINISLAIILSAFLLMPVNAMPDTSQVLESLENEEKKALNSKDKQWINTYIKNAFSQAQDHNIPSVAIVIVKKGHEPEFRFYGKTKQTGNSSNDAINAKTKFRLASVSKTFTAGLVAKTSNTNKDKLLNWQTPLSTLTPEYNFDNYQQPILLRHIIGQSAGFMPNAYDNLIEANYKRPRILRELGELESICKPGYCYTYQNALFGVIEEYYNKLNSSYSQALQENIFEPLGMQSTVGREALEASNNWARPHAAISRKKWRQVKVKDDYYRFSPAAGINASLEDMEKWLRALLLEKPKVFNAVMVEQMTQPRVQTRNELRRREWRKHLRTAHYGLGWRIYNFRGIKLNYHGGWVQGYRADVAFAPSLDIGVAILMNAESNVINTISAQFWEQAVKNSD